MKEINVKKSIDESDDTTKMGSIQATPNSEEEEERAKVVSRKEFRNAVIGTVLSSIILIALFVGVAAYKKHQDSLKFDKKGNPIKTKATSVYKTESFKSTFEYVTQNQQVKKLFNSKYIYFLANNKTGEVEDVAVIDAREFGNKDIAQQVFDIHTGDLIAYQCTHYGILDPEWWPEYYADYIRNDFTWIPISEAGQYVDGGLELKDSYTIDEITEISAKVHEGFKLVIDSGQLVL